MRKKVFAIIVVSIMALVLLVPMAAFAGQDCSDPPGCQECSDPCGCQECSDPCDCQECSDPCGCQECCDPCECQECSDPCGCQECCDPCEGLTPGYWKNHLSEWCDGYNEEIALPNIFKISELEEWGDENLLDALKFHGGPELDGMARNMLRHAVAALLNSCSSEVNYPYTKNDVIEMVRDVDWGSRSSMEDLKDTFEAANELGLHS